MFTQRQFVGCTLYACGSGGREAGKQVREERCLWTRGRSGSRPGRSFLSAPLFGLFLSFLFGLYASLPRAGPRFPTTTADGVVLGARPTSQSTRPTTPRRSHGKPTVSAALRFPARIILSDHDRIVAHRRRRYTRIALPGPTALWNFCHSTQPFTTISKNYRGVLPVPILRPRTWPSWQPGLF